MVREQSFHLVLAGFRYVSCGMRRLGIAAYATALTGYNSGGQSLAHAFYPPRSRTLCFPVTPQFTLYQPLITA